MSVAVAMETHTPRLWRGAVGRAADLCVSTKTACFSPVIQSVDIMNRQSATEEMKARNAASDSERGEVSYS